LQGEFLCVQSIFMVNDYFHYCLPCDRLGDWRVGMMRVLYCFRVVVLVGGVTVIAQLVRRVVSMLVFIIAGMLMRVLVVMRLVVSMVG